MEISLILLVILVVIFDIDLFTSIVICFLVATVFFGEDKTEKSQKEVIRETPHFKVEKTNTGEMYKLKSGVVIEEPKAEKPKAEEPKAEEPKAEEPKIELEHSSIIESSSIIPH